MKIKPIISIDIKDGSIKQYDSLIEAEKYGFKAPKISLCCGGKRKSHKGFFWLFKQSYKEESYQEYLKLYNDHTHEKIILEEKKCTKCGILKKIDDFNKRRTGRTGVYSACKDCEYKRHSKYKEQNIDKFKTFPSVQKEYRNKKKKERLQTDITFRLITNYRARVKEAFKHNKNRDKTNNLLGCSIKEFEKHIESQFDEKMSWDNYGKYGWHVDHIIPLCTAKNEEELVKLLHFSNTRPLWYQENLRRPKKG